jgi:hypothetical protein
VTQQQKAARAIAALNLAQQINLYWVKRCAAQVRNVYLLG